MTAMETARALDILLEQREYDPRKLHLQDGSRLEEYITSLSEEIGK